MVLTGGSNYSENTVVESGTVQLGGDNVFSIANGSDLTVNGTLDLYGYSEILNGLSGSGVIDNTFTGPATITLGNFGRTTNFSGIIQNTVDTVSLVKTGQGTFSLSNANTFSGTLRVQNRSVNGAVRLDDLDAIQNVSAITLAEGGYLSLPLDTTVVSAPITLDLGGGIISPTGNFETVTVASAIDGTGDFEVKNISGANARPIVVLGGVGTYDGNFQVNNTAGGTLAVQQSVANALPATAVLTIRNVGAGTGRYAEYDLNGLDLTVAGLTSVGAMADRAVIANSGATSATLTVNNANDFTYAGNLGSSGYAAGGFAPTLAGDDFRLVKSDIGVLTLSGTLSYTGDTTVNDGVLVLGAVNTNNESSTITISDTANAQLQLDYPGTDFVTALVIGSVAQADGVYGHTSSGADNGGQGVGFLDTYFADSTGTITVGVASGYAVWAAGFGNLTDTDPSIDFDNGGLDTGIEYIVGSNPSDASDDNLFSPTSTLVGGGLEFEFGRTLLAKGDPNVTIVVKYGSDLDGWTEAEDGIDGVSIAGNLGFYSPDDQVVVTLPNSLAVDGRLFARLKLVVTTL